MAKYAQLVATGLPPGVLVTVKDAAGKQVSDHYPGADSTAPDNRAIYADGDGNLAPNVFLPNGTYTVAYSGGSKTVTVSGAVGVPAASVYVDQATQAELDAAQTTNRGTFAPLAPDFRRPPVVPPTMIVDASNAGHGLTNSSSGGSVNLNDTTDSARGTQCVSLVTPGAATVARVDKTGLAFDFTGKDLVVWAKITNRQYLKQLSVFLGDSGLSNYIRFDLEKATAANSIGFNNFLALDSVWTKYVIPFTPGREVTDAATTASSPTVTSATAAFVAADFGRAVVGNGIPANSYVGIVNSATSIGLSSVQGSNTPVNATATATGVTVSIGNSFFGSTTLQGSTVALRSNIAQVRFHAQDFGVAGQTVTVKLDGIAAQAEPSAFLKGVVSFTMDDGFVEQAVALAYLAKYGYPATLLPIVDAIGTTGYLTLAQLKQYRDMAGCEIGGHAATTANHNAGFTTLPDAGLGEMQTNRAWLAANGFTSQTSAYPKGMFDSNVIAATQKVYNCARTTVALPMETVPPADPYKIRTIPLDSGLTLTQVKLMIEQCVASGAHAVLMLHKVGAVADTLTWTTSDFQALVDYIAVKGIAVRTLGDVLARTV